MAEIHPVCRLAKGQLHEWQGLPSFWAEETPPACLESTGEAGCLCFHHEPLAYRIFRLPQSSVQVWLFTGGSAEVDLVEVFGLPEDLDTQELGPPEVCFDYPLEARLQRLLGDPAANQKECVYAARGLSLLVSVTSNVAKRLIRVRGFHPMSADSYRDRFVDLPPVRWFTEA